MESQHFRPAWWLPGAHLQTIWPTLCRRRIKTNAVVRERVELQDGDFIDLDWAGQGTGPIVLILHGLEGSANSSYAQGMLRAVVAQGWRGVVMHFRSCSGELNRLPRMYHSGETQDVATIVRIIRAREADVKIAAIGFSLGANVLLKWLGETQQDNPLTAAIGVSIPFELRKTAWRVQRGFSRIYQWYFLKSLRRKLLHKLQKKAIPFAVPPAAAIRSIVNFDECITAPLHGFSSADDYYQQSSCRQYLKSIQVPTLLLQAQDDPFMTRDMIPAQDELSQAVKLEVSKRGGHVGFVTGRFPWQAEYWLERRAPAFFSQFLI